jgi:hypothetical protein
LPIMTHWARCSEMLTGCNLSVDGQSYTLAEQTITALQATFSRIGHRPTPAMWDALQAVADTLDQMANKTAAPLVYVSSLDPGVGKTTTVIHFLRVLLTSDAHQGVSALVCVSRRDQIRTITQEAALLDGDFAVLTADAELNALGCAVPAKARVLFTTHSMVERRCDGKDFRSTSAFHYRGHAREVRIWDEAILPGRPLTISRDDLGFLFKPLRFRHPALADDIETLFRQLGEAADGQLMQLPEVDETRDVSLNDALQIVDGGPADQVSAVETLWFLFGKTVTIRKDGVFGNTVLDYRDTLPNDIGPLLTLDASARVRATYSLWKVRRGGIEMLPSAPKRYDRHTCHIWNQAGGKSAFRRHGQKLIDGIVKAILSRPNEEWLVVHHKNVGIDVPSSIIDMIPSGGPTVHFVNWGSHDATNRYAHVPNVILAGTLFYRGSYYEALGRLAAAQPSAHGAFPLEDEEAVIMGENCHLILQALCRGAVRRCEGGGCPETRTYIIASSRSNIASTIPFILPGAKIERWQPVERELSGKVKSAFEYITERLAVSPDNIVSFNDVQQHIGCPDRSNFNRTIRNHGEFRQALADEAIAESGSGKRPTGFALEVPMGVQRSSFCPIAGSE